MTGFPQRIIKCIILKRLDFHKTIKREEGTKKSKKTKQLIEFARHIDCDKEKIKGITWIIQGKKDTLS